MKRLTTKLHNRKQGRKFVQEKCHRRSIRLRGYDYASAGAYFVTACTKARECLFGSIVDSKFRSNDVGRIVQDAWNTIPDRCASARIDTFVVMPNHIHGIVILVGAGLALPEPEQRLRCASREDVVLV